jgi:hypothetical protein
MVDHSPWGASFFMRPPAPSVGRNRVGLQKIYLGVSEGALAASVIEVMAFA